MEAMMHIGSVLLIVWLVIGGIAAGQRGDFNGTMGCSSAGTIEGARCLGRDDEFGSLEPGKLADVALWRMDDLAHAGIADPVAALVLGPPRPVDTLLVGGRAVVEGGELRTASEHEITTDIARASRRLAGRVEATL